MAQPELARFRLRRESEGPHEGRALAIGRGQTGSGSKGCAGSATPPAPLPISWRLQPVPGRDRQT